MLSAIRSDVRILLGLVGAGLLVCLVFAFYLFVPVSGSLLVRVFDFPEGGNVRQFTDDLQKAGVIRSALAARLYLQLTGSDLLLQAGSYELGPGMSVPQIVHKMVTGDVVSLLVTIPEGKSAVAINELLRSSCMAHQLPECIFRLDELRAADFVDDFPFLEVAASGASLEGFLLPDTYHFPLSVTTESAARTLLETFEEKALPLFAGRKDFFERLIVASLLEKEVPTLQDKKLVAGIIATRMELGMRLQIDATIIYVTGKKAVSIDDTFIESPYNTYRVQGLPPGPIANPGVESIAAALDPVSSPYLFYLSAKDGTTIFSKTFAEHTQNKAKYLR